MVDWSTALATSATVDIEADGLWMSVGYAPATRCCYQAGARMRYDDEVAQFVPADCRPACFACGKVNGCFDLERRERDGRHARGGTSAAAHAAHGNGTPKAVRDRARP